MSFAVYLAGLGLIAAVAWATASPLLVPPRIRRALDGELPEEGRWRRRKEEALTAIRDAEFDLHLGKLSAEDYRDLRARLETQALEAMAELERLARRDMGSRPTEAIERVLQGHGESR